MNTNCFFNSLFLTNLSCYSFVMMIAAVEDLSEVKEAAAVLRMLEENGLKEPVIAAGWTRSLICGGTTADIDVSYVGEIHFEQAQDILKQALEKVNPSNKQMWDVKGIWNAQMAYGVKHTVDNLLLHYLNSIDSVYLAADGKLHDPTGFGFNDAETKTLRINDYDLVNRVPTASEHVNVCIENCRRLAKFGWTPTERTTERIRQGVAYWDQLSKKETTYFISKLKTKYSQQERSNARLVYDTYGWGFIFDL
jgi:hypothetical protein